eukprot:TRINITY_DN5695_c0_g1_i3.p1 TRINITY_DN5695_c0_g1~~TRINITY_DN5695_c0_g1_i3.p1  ORF type:complete len:182 (-),score=17.38 TRINITY_DN5695_c0_g1_i3:98-643(-)
MKIVQLLLLNPVFNYFMDRTIEYFKRISNWGAGKIFNWFGFNKASCDTGNNAIPEPMIENQTTDNMTQSPKPMIENMILIVPGGSMIVECIIVIVREYVSRSKNTQREKYIIEAMEEYTLTLQEQLEILAVEEPDMNEDMKKRVVIRVAINSCKSFLKGKLNRTDAEKFVELLTRSHSLLL